MLALALFLTTVAPAQLGGSLRIDLDWQAPPSCPKSADIDGDVRRILGDAPVPADLQAIAARASLTPSDDGSYRLVLRTKSASFERERSLYVEGCEEARDLVAFLLAMLVDPNARRHEEISDVAAPVSTPLPVPERTPAASPHASQRDGREPRAGGERALRFVASLSGGAELGVLPAASPGGEVRAGLLLPNWALKARGALWQPRRADSPTLTGAGGEFSLMEAGALGCVHWAGFSRLSYEVCAGPALLYLRGRGFGVREPGAASALWMGASGDGAVLWEISAPLALRGTLGVLVPFERPTFAIRNVGTIQRSRAVAGRALLGLEARF